MVVNVMETDTTDIAFAANQPYPSDWVYSVVAYDAGERLENHTTITPWKIVNGLSLSGGAFVLNEELEACVAAKKARFEIVATQLSALLKTESLSNQQLAETLLMLIGQVDYPQRTFIGTNSVLLKLLATLSELFKIKCPEVNLGAEADPVEITPELLHSAIRWKNEVNVHSESKNPLSPIYEELNTLVEKYLVEIIFTASLRRHECQQLAIEITTIACAAQWVVEYPEALEPGSENRLIRLQQKAAELNTLFIRHMRKMKEIAVKSDAPVAAAVRSPQQAASRATALRTLLNNLIINKL